MLTGESLHRSDQVSELLLQRDSAALESLIAWYRPILRAMASRDLDQALGAKVDASDIVQEAFEDVARNFHRLDVDNRFQFLSYLKAVLRNKIQDMRRRFILSQKRNIHREHTFSTLGPSAQLEMSNVAISQMDETIQQEFFDRLQTVMERMPSELQQVLRWRFQNEMTYKQIGDKLERSEDDVRMLIKRCLARMKPEVFPNGWSV